MNSKRIILGLGLLAFPGALWASGPGTTAASVLGIGVGARAVSMGEAYTAMADDLSSLYWNPAGIALLNQSAASFMYNQSYRDMNFNTAGLGLSLENGGIGGSLSYLGYGDIQGFDQTGTPTGNVNAYTGVATVGGGWLFDDFSVGADVKAVQGQLADVKATGVAFDAGGTYVYPQTLLGGSTLRLATTVRNMGPGMTYLEQKDSMPTEWRVGSSLLELFDKKLNLSLDYGKARGNDGSIYSGAEFWLNPFLALRTGYTGNHTEGDGLRAGIGLRIHNLSFDYAYSNFGELGLSHRYELTYRFGEIRPRLTPEERRLLRQAKRAIREERYAEAVLLMDSLMRMEPNYHSFPKIYKTALRGNEQQEKFAKGQNTFTVIAPHNKTAAANLPELDDLEQLLKTSEEAVAQAPAKEKK